MSKAPTGLGWLLRSTSQWRATLASSPHVWLLVGACTLLLAWQSAHVGLRMLHPFGLQTTLNDQIIYFDTARRLADGHGLNSGFIYPSTVLQETRHNFLYLPGHVAVLSLSFIALGVGSVQALLPSLLGFVLAMLAIYATCRLWEAPLPALCAALVCACYPPLVLFAVSAMSEATVLAAVCWCLFGALAAKGRRRLWALPIASAVAVLFKENALLVLPILLCIGVAELREQRARLWPLALASTAAGMVVLAGLWLFGGRPSLFLENLWYASTDMSKYVRLLPDRAAVLDAWPELIRGKMRFNFETLQQQLVQPYPWFRLQKVCYALLAATSVAAVGLALFTREERRRWVAYAAGLGFLLVPLLTIYDVADLKAVRFLLVLLPVQAWVLARGFAWLSQKHGAWAASVAAAALCFGALQLVARMTPQVTAGDSLALAEEQFLSDIQPSSEGAFVGPVLTALTRTLTTPDSLSAPTPGDVPTLRATGAKYRIATLVVTVAEVQALGLAELSAQGLSYDHDVERYDHQRFAIYRRNSGE